MRVARHLVKNKLGHFYVRVYVPKDLKFIVKKNELRRSLKTTCEATAVHRSVPYVEQFRQYFCSLRREHGMFEDNIFMSKMISISSLTRNFADGSSEVAKDLVLEGDIEEKYLNGALGSSADGTHQVNENVVQVTSPSSSNEGPQPILSDQVIDDVFLIERPTFTEVSKRFKLEREQKRVKAGKPLNKKWNSDYQLLEELFCELYGDYKIDLYSETIANDFFGVLRLLPAYWRIRSMWSGMPVREILDDERLEDADKLSRGRIGDLEGRMHAIFCSAVKTGKLKYSVFNGFLSKKVGYNRASGWKPFSKDDLKVIFAVDHVNLNKSCASHFWVPLIALYSGMRRSEIFFRTVSDIKRDEGVWYFDVNREHGAHTKNESSVRKIPIHSAILQRRFLEFVESIKEQRGADARLFPEYKDRDSQAGHKFSDYFAKYLDTVEIPERLKVFHSFRTTFINALEQQSVYPPALMRLAGHSTGDITHDVYGGQSPMVFYQEFIEKLNFETELSGLSVWPF